MFDVVVAGGGPAGLNAALMLGRARRTVLLCDSGQPRNAAVHAMHGFLSRDGTDPAALRQTARDQLGPYPTVRVRDVAIQAVGRDEDQLTITLGDGTSEQARRLLLATGVADQLPPIPGLAELWGRGVFNCPYCDGWEVRDQPLAVLASDPRNFQLALQLTCYSPDVLLASNGPAGLDDDARGLLAAHKVALREEPSPGWTAATAAWSASCSTRASRSRAPRRSCTRLPASAATSLASSAAPCWKTTR